MNEEEENNTHTISKNSIKWLGATVFLGLAHMLSALLQNAIRIFSSRCDCVMLFLFLCFRTCLFMLFAQCTYNSPFLLLDVLALSVYADGITTQPNKYIGYRTFDTTFTLQNRNKKNYIGELTRMRSGLA